MDRKWEYSLQKCSSQISIWRIICNRNSPMSSIKRTQFLSTVSVCHLPLPHPNAEVSSTRLSRYPRVSFWLYLPQWVCFVPSNFLGSSLYSSSRNSWEAIGSKSLRRHSSFIGAILKASLESLKTRMSENRSWKPTWNYLSEMSCRKWPKGGGIRTRVPWSPILLPRLPHPSFLPHLALPFPLHLSSHHHSSFHPVRPWPVFPKSNPRQPVIYHWSAWPSNSVWSCKIAISYSMTYSSCSKKKAWKKCFYRS